MTPIIQALGSGYSTKKILDFLSKSDPQLALKINTALQAGHSIERILSFLNRAGKSVSPMLEGGQGNKNIYEQAQKGIHPAVGQFAGAATALGVGALGAYALGRALPQAVQQLAPEIAGGALTGRPGPSSGLTPPPTSQSSPLAPSGPSSPTPPTPPVGPTPTKPDILEQMGLGDRVRELAKDHPPQDIAGILEQHLMSSGQRKWLKEQTQEPLANIVKDFLGKTSPAPPTPAIGTPETQQIRKTETIHPKEQITQPEAPNEVPQPKMVALPGDRIGQVESIKNGIAKINVDGEIRHRKLEDVIESPLPEKDMADLYTDLVKGIHKETGQEPSRNVYWAGYDPKTNELAYIPHNGPLYIYDDISPEDAEALTGVLTQRKSTGENYIGAWKAGTDSPIGAAMYQLIRKLQGERGGKGNEYAGKFEKIYDALEPAAIKAKKKYEEEKRKRKKKANT